MTANSYLIKPRLKLKCNKYADPPRDLLATVDGATQVVLTRTAPQDSGDNASTGLYSVCVRSVPSLNPSPLSSSYISSTVTAIHRGSGAETASRKKKNPGEKFGCDSQ